MRFSGAALAVSGLVALSALGASLAAVEAAGAIRARTSATFSVIVLHPLLPTDLKTDRVPLGITNTGGAAGWPDCRVVAASTTGSGTATYWSTSRVRASQTVHTDVRVTIVNGGVRTLSSRDVSATCRAASGPGPSPPSRPRVVVPAVTPTTLPPRDVGNLQMFTTNDGVAVAGIEEPSGLAGPAYLLSTTDGGVTWSATGTLPLRLSRLDLVTSGLAFEDARVGYLEIDDRSEHRDAVYFTDDGGADWSRVTAPVDPTRISLDGSSLWVTGDVCGTPTLRPQSCDSQLLTYIFGALVPSSVAPIPVLTQSAGTEYRLLGRLGAASGVFTATSGSSSDLVVTTDAGLDWQLLDDPCAGKAGMPVRGLVATAPGRWLLLCEIDGGMMNYEVRLYGTSNAAESWQLVAENNVTQSLPKIGNIGAGFSLTASADGGILWKVGVAGGVGWSTDGGLDWTGSYPIATGGGAVDLATAGASDAWIAVPGKGLYFTADGTTWRELR